MRPSGPARPSAIASAVAVLCDGTRPSARAAPASRQPATYAARALEHRAAGLPVRERKPRMRGAAAPIGRDRAPVACGLGLTRPSRLRGGAVAERREEGEIRSLRPVPMTRENGCSRTTVPPSTRGGRLRQRRSACPSPSAAALIGFRGSRGRCDLPTAAVRRSCRTVVRRRRSARGAAYERLRVGDRGRPGQRRDDVELAGRAGEHAAPQHGGRRVEQSTERGAADRLDRLGRHG